MNVEFEAFDYGADQSFRRARYRFAGSETTGWLVERDGQQVLELGPGYRTLRVRQCGVCSTDLARHHLPFPLPQVIGHEVVAVSDGRRYVVEINASHTARGVAHDCAFCRAGLPTHCPDRRTLGIHDLPGGFGPWILAPVGACLPVPDGVPDSAAVLVEPLAAALHAVDTVAPRPGERIAVLGPRRLGMLVVAALAARRAQQGGTFEVVAIVRDPALLPLVRQFGATTAMAIGDDHEGHDAAFDVVIDTTGNPVGLDRAVRMARREVHLKSTHGQPSSGLRRLTGLVVDELGLARFPAAAPPPGEAVWDRLRTAAQPRIAWLPAAAPPAWLTERADVRRGAAAELAVGYQTAADGLPRADVAVAGCAADVDAAIRPFAGREQALVRPCGAILVPGDAAVGDSPLLQAIATRGLALSSSRCGDFAAALRLLAADPELRRVGERLITHRFAATELPEAFKVARSRGCIKAVVAHPAGAS